MSNDSISNNKRIAKNTMLLYVRMLLIMAVTLYTSRVILSALGETDFGIYNVVGGVVTMFSVLSGSLSAAISRFITFELGKGDTQKLKRIFSSSVTIQLILGGIIILVAETIGLWFLNCKMNIPAERMVAANWVFQFSIVTFCINLLSVPYNAAIIAHEKMSAFAYISIIEAGGKLLIAFLILKSPEDQLIYYGLLMMLISIGIRSCYTWYCKKYFEECKFQFFFDQKLLKEMLGFAGWNFLGAGSHLLMTQGVNIVINLFFGVFLNAARGIAVQIENATMQFVNSFTTAINPQITKAYAKKDFEYLYKLMFVSTKTSYFLLLFLTVPLILETDFILNLWLKEVPNYAIDFVRYTLIISMISILSNSMITAMLATGDIKEYQLIVGGLGMCVLPTVYVLFKLGFPVEYAYYTHLLVFILQLICRLKLMKKMIRLKTSDFINKIILRILPITIISFSLPYLLMNNIASSFSRLILTVSISSLTIVFSIFIIGLERYEKNFIVQKLKKLKRDGH